MARRVALAFALVAVMDAVLFGVAGRVTWIGAWIFSLMYLALLLVALLVTAALDAGRYHWSALPPGARVLGVAGTMAASAVIGWAVMVNAFLSRWARIQDDRGQTVVRDGPYRFVRHPMYAGIIVLMGSASLVLGSTWALVPAGLIGVLYVIRTALEDRMLRAELPGYAEYAHCVHARLLPGIW